MRRSKRRPRREPRSPYESLLRGVQSDQRLGQWFQRALWSFHRAPFPTQEDPEAQDEAMARAFEWFLFDVKLPDSGRTPAEEWITTTSRQQRWAPHVSERYLRFTRGEYGLFEITAVSWPILVLQQLGSRRTVHAIRMEDWEEWSIGERVAARLFPMESIEHSAADRETFEVSPGSSRLPQASRHQLQAAASEGPLGVEVLYGASPTRLAEWFAEGPIADLFDAFLDLVFDGGVTTEDLRRELGELEDPGPPLAALLQEIVPLTSEEPALLGALLSAYWLELRRDAGASDKTLRKLAKRWERTLTTSDSLANERARPVLPFDEVSWTLSEHEIARLRTLPLAEGVQWVGRRRMTHVTIQEEGKLPEYPDAILWMEQPTGLVVQTKVVPRSASADVILRSLVDAMAEPRSGHTPRRPAEWSFRVRPGRTPWHPHAHCSGFT